MRLVLQGGIPVGSRGTLYYNAAAGRLPGNAAPQLHAGVNRWETLHKLDMQPCDDLALPDSAWWSIELAFDEVCSPAEISVLVRTCARCRFKSAAMHVLLSVLLPISKLKKLVVG